MENPLGELFCDLLLETSGVVYFQQSLLGNFLVPFSVENVGEFARETLSDNSLGERSGEALLRIMWNTFLKHSPRKFALGELSEETPKQRSNGCFAFFREALSRGLREQSLGESSLTYNSCGKHNGPREYAKDATPSACVHSAMP